MNIDNTIDELIAELLKVKKEKNKCDIIIGLEFVYNDMRKFIKNLQAEVMKK